MPSNRVVAPNVLTTELAEAIPAGTEIIAGHPQAAVAELADLGDVGVGLWRMTVGEAVDVESDELFLVLEGAGSVEFEDGDVVDLAPGVLVRLSAGDRTHWRVTEPIRKLYVSR